MNGLEASTFCGEAAQSNIEIRRETCKDGSGEPSSQVRGQGSATRKGHVVMNTKPKREVQSAAPAPARDPASAKGLSKDAARALGKRLRDACPRSSHSVWKAPKDRSDPVQMVLNAEKGRVPELLPMRHGRMARSSFTFYRGAALTMASDLATTPVSGMRVQCCGDAHLCNFGGFATPERRVIFSINDLDETLPDRGSGTSSASPQASWWPAGTTA